MVKKIISVNKHRIQQNIKHPDNLQPPIRIQHGSQIEYVNEFHFSGDAVIKYSPDNPLKCGARVWIEIDGSNKE